MCPQSNEEPSGPIGSFRETLFGDMPLSSWAAAGTGEPWARFSNAAARLDRRDRTGAMEELRSILHLSGLESRHYLEAWCGLRDAGVAPAPDEAKHVYGIVLDVPVNSGLDTLAAYEDRRARYINFSGAVIVWDIGHYRNINEQDGEPIQMADAIDAGHLKFWLDGVKVTGGYALTRTDDEPRGQWLLVKIRDRAADPRGDLTVSRPESVLSGRTIEDLAAEAGG